MDAKTAVILAQRSHEWQRYSWQPPLPTSAPMDIFQYKPVNMPQDEDSTIGPPLPHNWFNDYYMPPPVREDPRIDYYTEQWPRHPTSQQDHSYLNHDYEQQHLSLVSSPCAPYSHLQYPSTPDTLCTSEYQSPAAQYPLSPDIPPTPPSRPSGSSLSSGPSIFIEPDPLPPHSNPQALTVTQSRAFSASRPISAVRIGKDDIYCTSTGLTTFSITREAAHVPVFLSTKPLLTITRLSNTSPIGYVKFRTLTTTSSIEMNVNGHATTLSHKSSRMLHHSRRRWCFHSTSTPNKAELWYWKHDRATGGAVLEEGKGGKAKVLAKLKGDLLTFENAHLTGENYDEVVCSAVAMAEAARRAGKGRDVVDLGSAIGDFAAGADGNGRGAGGRGCA